MKKPKQPGSLSAGPLKAKARKPPSKSDSRWYWQVWYNEGGKQRTAQYKGKSANRRATPAEMRAHLTEVLAGDWQAPQIIEQSSDENTTIDGVCVHYLLTQQRRVERGRLKEKSLQVYKSIYKRVVGSFIADLLVDKLRDKHLQRWINELEDDGLSPRSIRSSWTFLRQSLSHGVDHGLVPDKRFKTPEMPKIEGYLYNHTTPTKAEVQSAIDKFTGWKHIALSLLLGTGARVREITDLQWPQWDRTARLLTLDGKTGKRTLPANDTVQRLLLEWWMQQGQPRKGRIFAATTASNQLHKHLKPYGFSPHGIRRCVSTILIDAGTTPKNYEAIMGHSYQMGLKTYASSRPERVLTAVNLLGK